MTIQFESPYLLLLLLVIPLLVLRHLWANRKSGPATMQYAVIGLTYKLPRSWRATFRPLMVMLRLTAIALIIIALARPQTVEGHQIVIAKGIDISLVLDISGSMSSRMDGARSAIREFISSRPFDRIGMVVFANQAFVLTPLTLDRAHVLKALDRVQLAPELGLDDGTAIGSALAHAANLMNGGPSESQVVILLTDGINNAGSINPLKAAEVANALDIRVYTIFAGLSGEYRVQQKDESGEIRLVTVNSDQDEQVLKDIAELTGGRYFLMEDSEGLQTIYDEIDTLEKTDVEIQSYELFSELASWFLLPALAILLIEMVLHRTLFRKLP